MDVILKFQGPTQDTRGVATALVFLVMQPHLSQASPRHGRKVGTLWIPFYRLQGTRPTTSATDVVAHVVSPVCNDFASPKTRRVACVAQSQGNSMEPLSENPNCQFISLTLRLIIRIPRKKRIDFFRTSPCIQTSKFIPGQDAIIFDVLLRILFNCLDKGTANVCFGK